MLLLLLLIQLPITTFAKIRRVAPDSPRYGVDVSFPMHHHMALSTNYAWLPHNVDPVNNPTPPEHAGVTIQPMPGRMEFYKEFLRGCAVQFDRDACDYQELERTHTSYHQAIHMKNFTANGFHKMKMPPELFERIQHYWNTNTDKIKSENQSDAYINFWVNPPQMVNFEDPETTYTDEESPLDLRESILDVTQPILEEWM
eukprot:CAMPEP_0172491412 /NCGR_PEP_ID=MMETSP1066-20121228/22226_1 /TAXON_ID=671091 /ORGANISM="Coscinodiscus wailesii, Strain CCMP2513" /LENGTH=199 /DNA_ID=CAMNT_0013260453 /DNA_START=131 /DNA_END=727 /DNA_ORIENTATION=+